MDFYAKEDAVALLPDLNEDGSEQIEQDAELADEDSEIVLMIKELLEEKVRPMAQDDGGDVIFRGFDANNGIVNVQLVGSCSGCPSSTVTLKNGVENMLRHYIPEVKRVDAVTGDLQEHHLSFGEAH